MALFANAVFFELSTCRKSSLFTKYTKRSGSFVIIMNTSNIFSWGKIWKQNQQGASPHYWP